MMMTKKKSRKERKKVKAGRTNVNVNVPKELGASLNRLLQKTRRNVSAEVILALENHIRREEERIKREEEAQQIKE